MGIYLCFRIKKLKFLSSTFCRRKGGANRRCGARAEGACTLCRAARRKRRECGLKPRGDKFSGSQLAVGKMVACALLRVKRSPFLNPPPALCPFSENSSAAFLLSPTEYFLSHVIPRLAEQGDGDPPLNSTQYILIFYWRIAFATFGVGQWRMFIYSLKL